MKLAHQLDPSIENEDLTDWMNRDSDDKGYYLLSDEDIVRNVTQTDETIQEDEEDESAEIEGSVHFWKSERHVG